MAHEDLTFPRRVYKGTPVAKGALPDPVESKRVEDREAYDAALKDGWRQHRDDGKPVKADTRGTIALPAQRIETEASVEPRQPEPKVDETDKIAGEAARKAEASGKPAKADKNAGALPAPARNRGGKK